MGRYGNFLFQCATAMAYALSYDLSFTVPTFTRDAFWNPLYFPHLRNVAYDEKLPAVLIEEKQHSYYALPYEDHYRSSNIIFVGYWQSYKYFELWRDVVLNKFRIPWEMDQGYVSLHVRRGDYLRYPSINPLATHEYYAEAVKTFKLYGYRKFKVFSDDLSWCAQEFKHPDYVGCEFQYPNVSSIESDLIRLSCCEHNIMSNSTYAWWGAWLNRNPKKIVICPHEDNYYGPANKHLDVSTLYPPEWIRIKY